MRHLVRLERDGDVAEIVLDCPPAKALGPGVRRSILSSLEAAETDKTVRAIVITTESGSFAVGATPSSDENADEYPSLADLCLKIEACEKPVIMALQGAILGGGLELAMAGHYRVAASSTMLGLTAIRLGVIPSAGGTQRLPRLVGIDAALTMMLSGKPIAAQAALKIGLIDWLAEGDVRPAASAFFSEGMRPNPTSQRRQHLKDPPGYLAKVKTHEERVSAYYQESPAANAIISCAKAPVLMPFDAACSLEARAYSDCLVTDEAQGLQHAARAERVAPQFIELRNVPEPELKSVGIIGGGELGAAIATMCLDVGLPVSVVERNTEMAKATLGRIANHFRPAIEKGRITDKEAANALELLDLGRQERKLDQCDVIFEALPEDLELKSRILAQAGRIAKPSAIFASTSSYIDIQKLSQASGRPEQFLGLHFLAPAEQMRLVEVIAPKGTQADALAMGHKTIRKLGKLPVRAGLETGYIVNRVQTRLRRAADRILCDGASPLQVDAAMRIFGFEQGPYQLLDKLGLEVGQKGYDQIKAGAGMNDSDLLNRMIDQGYRGREAGQGFYLYDKKMSRNNLNRRALTVIAIERDAHNITKRRVLQPEIHERLLLAMINECALILEERGATRASDIDAALIHGMGYPRRQGGPLHQADRMGVFHVLRKIEEQRAKTPGFGRPAPLLVRLAKERAQFADLGTTLTLQ